MAVYNVYNVYIWQVYGGIQCIQCLHMESIWWYTMYIMIYIYKFKKKL